MPLSKSALHNLWVFLAILLFAGVMLWGYLDQSHLVPHVKLARISSSAWQNHQSKQCASWNAKAPQPLLECDQGHADIQQTLPVRFYGDTRRALDPDTLRFFWLCQKSDDSRPSITCKLAPEP